MHYELIFSTHAKADYQYWQHHHPKIVAKIDRLIEDIQAHPFTGLGKPEPLKHELSGYWSRRLDTTHRLVYKIYDGIIFIAQCRHHYH